MTAVPAIALNDGHTIPQLGLGVWRMTPEECRASVAHALEVGYRHIDTASFYENEEAVGQAVASSGIARDEIFVTTKLGNDRHTDAPAALRESLDKLGLDRVDLYLIHWPVPSRQSFVQAWQSLIELRDQGLATSIGVSNFNEDHLLRIIEETGVAPAVNQIEAHPSFARFDQLQIHATHQIVTESWSPLGRGEDLDSDIVHTIAERTGKTPAQVVLRWHIQRGLVVIPKSVTPARIDENIDIFDFELTEADMRAMHELDKKKRMGPDPRVHGA
ncbi:aldo/keto reductase [Nigerium massiliense]|uniref:aldo/keto reductase n=1 Tax=Nigerium massiliense TaxID=1522317 RepID=UPI00058BA04E|nr:aldo/keto reductase [Nigerium massiliense]